MVNTAGSVEREGWRGREEGDAGNRRAEERDKRENRKGKRIERGEKRKRVVKGRCREETYLIVSSGRSYHDTHNTQRTLTSSDHIPAIFTVSIHCHARMKSLTTLSNREQNKTIIDLGLADLNLDGKSTNDIKAAVDNAIKINPQTVAPLLKYETLPYPTPSREKGKELRYTNISVMLEGTPGGLKIINKGNEKASG